MKEGLHFRPYAAADDSDLSRLIREILGRDCDGRILEWKYRRNPAGDPLSVVAEKHGKVIGQIGAVPVRFFVRGNEHIGSQEVDGCLDKEQGKFDTLFHMIRLRRKINREKGIAFSYFFSVEISSQIAQKLGHIRVCSAPLLLKPLDVEPFLQKKLPALLARMMAPPLNAVLRRMPRASASIPKGTRLRRIERFDKRFDEFWDRIKGDYPIMAVRDSAYLNWRYVDVPYRNYTTLSLERETTGDILGFTVLLVQERDIRVGHIMDILTARNGGAKTTRVLLCQALKHFHERKVALVCCWMLPHCHVFPELRKLLFFRRAKPGRDLIVQIEKGEGAVMEREFAANPENWYACLGDSDFY